MTLHEHARMPPTVHSFREKEREKGGESSDVTAGAKFKVRLRVEKLIFIQDLAKRQNATLKSAILELLSETIFAKHILSKITPAFGRPKSTSVLQ